MVLPSFSFPSLHLALVLFMTIVPAVLAQAGTYFGHFIDEMNAEGYTNFTAWVHEVGADTPTSPFFQTINSAPTYTLFIPNNDAFANPSANFYPGVYQNNNPIFLSSLLDYHLLPGAWLQSQLGSGYNHTILSTTMQADPPTLQVGVPQQLACGSTANGFEVYNQRTTMAVQKSFQFDDMIINVVNAVLAPPSAYDTVATNMGFTQFEALRNAAGAISPALVGGGLTFFVPSDDAFAAANASGALDGMNATDIYNDHTMFGQSIWSSLFSSGTYAAASGYAYTFGTSDQGYTVTLNGVTANIVQSDVLLTNGVVHVIDKVLVSAPTAGATSSAANGVNGPISGPSPTATSTSGDSVGSASESESSAATSSAPANTGLGVSGASHDAHVITPGIVVAIVAIALVLLTVLLTLLYVFVVRRRRARRHGADSSVFDLPSPALRTDPFYTQASTSSVVTPVDLHPPRGYGASTVSSVSIPPEAKVMPEKVDGPFHVHGIRAYSDADASAPPSIVIPTEVVDQIVQQLARRIDRDRERVPAALPPGLEEVPDDAPPLYESPPPRLNIIFDHERNEEV